MGGMIPAETEIGPVSLGCVSECILVLVQQDRSNSVEVFDQSGANYARNTQLWASLKSRAAACNKKKKGRLLTGLNCGGRI